MPPLECANFLECENKTVCVAPFDLPHGSNTICFSSHTRNLSHSPCWAAGLLFFLAKMAWNAIVCETTDVSGGNSIFLIIQNTWFQAILAKQIQKKKKKRKKKVKNVSFTEYEDFTECADLAECDDLTVCVPPQLWSAMPSLECEEFVECEEFRVCVAGIETT